MASLKVGKIDCFFSDQFEDEFEKFDHSLKEKTKEFIGLAIKELMNESWLSN